MDPRKVEPTGVDKGACHIEGLKGGGGEQMGAEADETGPRRGNSREERNTR